ncbi:hypothetical protein DC429_02820 [Arthrobacter sp. TPD3018]|uniref:hypothetical protein n=1 Tax=Bacteria TaxID=2 RepID=UPI000D507885|nr:MULTISPECIES: hypothetical protein [Bacteria]PVE59355.1 hypothetical protein DC425_02815 [Sphingomonas sp. TPD3009]PVE60875.1 hypothetical protein DC429_02820 [Arthrobacter sp. TPD3018]PVE87555.1 hypothetical protein DC431_02815 [Sphingomonas melonis]
MFVDFREPPPPPPPWRPKPRDPRPQLTPRQQNALAAIIGVNVLLLLIAPIGGATVIQAISALFR